MEIITISSEYIKLDQLLKFASIVGNGSDAKFLVQEGYVKVDGEVDTRRGRKLYGNGEIVEIDCERNHFELKVVR